MNSLCLFVTVYILGKCSGQISSKLDFGSSESTTSGYESALSTSLVRALVSLHHSTGTQKQIISSRREENPFNLRSVASSLKDSDFPTIGVVCVDQNCNKTKKNGGQLSTDVVVQVVTNIGEKNNKTVETTGAEGDVPIVVGYAGTNFKPSGLESSSRRIDGSDDITFQSGGKHFYYLQKDNEVPRSHQVPHFNPSFNYFNSQPSQIPQVPQYVWYRRNSQAFNPNIRSYKPFNQWLLKYPTPQSQVHIPSGWTTTCACSNPNWYPNSVSAQPTTTSINNKLAPLN